MGPDGAGSWRRRPRLRVVAASRRQPWEDAPERCLNPQARTPAPQCQSFPELFPFSYAKFTRTRQTTKTYHGFLGMIFLGGVRSLQVHGHQGLACLTTTKKWKNTTAKVIFFARIPSFFCQTGSFLGHFLLYRYFSIGKLLPMKNLQELKNHVWTG